MPIIAVIRGKSRVKLLVVSGWVPKLIYECSKKMIHESHKKNLAKFLVGLSRSKSVTILITIGKEHDITISINHKETIFCTGTIHKTVLIHTSLIVKFLS